MWRRAFVIIFFVLLFAPYYEGTLTSVNAQQNGISSTSAVNWEEDKETILKVLNKVKSKEIISDEDYEKIREALEESDSLDAFISSVDSLTVEVYLERVYESQSFKIIAGIVKWTFGNEKINIYITLENGSVLKFCADVQDAVAELKEGELPNPTINIYANEGTLRSIMESDDPFTALQVALIDGDIKYEGVGIANAVKLALTNTLSKAYGFFNPSPFEVTDEAKEIKYKGEEATLKINPKGVRYVEFQGGIEGNDDVIIIDKYGCERGYTTKRNLKLMQTDTEELTSAAGIYTKPLSELKAGNTFTEVAEIRRLMREMQNSATSFSIMNKTFYFITKTKAFSHI